MHREVVGSDALPDVALVKIDANDLPVVQAGDPARTEAGDRMMAIGSPYGFSNTVTSGIVSAKSRSLPGEVKKYCAVYGDSIRHRQDERHGLHVESRGDMQTGLRYRARS